MARNIAYNRDYYTLETYRKDDTLELLGRMPIRHTEKIARKNLIYSLARRDVVHWNKIEKEVKELRFLIKQTVLTRTNLLDLDLRYLSHSPEAEVL